MTLGAVGSGAIDIHCPNCGEFVYEKSAKNCPRCGSNQIITLFHRHDIDANFQADRENARPERYKVRP